MIKNMVSIITPCYNGSRFISQTIDSVLAQSWRRWEMIIVDDGSTDHSAEIIEKYSGKDRRIKYVYQENAGSAAARNRGIRLARGQYIALLDADDLWDPDFLRRQIHFMKRKDAVCVFSSYRRIDEWGKEVLRPTIAKKQISLKEMKIMNQIGCLTGLYDITRHGKIYLREELKSLRDDYAYWYDIVSLENRAYGNRRILASYRVLSDSTTGNKKKLIAKQYKFYRTYLQEPPWVAVKNTIIWGIIGMFKFF